MTKSKDLRCHKVRVEICNALQQERSQHKEEKSTSEWADTFNLKGQCHEILRTIVSCTSFSLYLDTGYSLFFLLFLKFRKILYSAFPDTNRSPVTILNDMSARLKIGAELIHEKILKSKFYGTIPLRSLNFKKIQKAWKFEAMWDRATAHLTILRLLLTRQTYPRTVI